MRINEEYEHEPLIPYQGTHTCPDTGCDKTAVQCVDVVLPMVLTPTATAGTVTTTCSGSPTVNCVTAADGLSCMVTVTQRVCVSIPVRFGVEEEPETVTIACGGTDAESECTCLT